MRKRISDFINRESLKMRDVAFGPVFYFAAAIPVVLLILVAAVVIFAIVKIVKISKDKKNKVE